MDEPNGDLGVVGVVTNGNVYDIGELEGDILGDGARKAPLMFRESMRVLAVFRPLLWVSVVAVIRWVSWYSIKFGNDK